MVLPWGNTTVIGRVVSVLEEAQVEAITVVTGSDRLALEAALAGRKIHFVFNPQFENGEMLFSIQIGLASLPADRTAALIVLGDQPQIQAGLVRTVCSVGEAHPEAMTIPSYQMRRGHPWLLPRRFWPDVLAIRLPLTLRDFVQAHAEQIVYVDVQTPTVLMDLDTEEEYLKAVERVNRPEGSRTEN